MGELILHIGTTKTGTTSLQGFFSMNRERLAAHGIDYPEFTAQSLAPQNRNGSFFCMHCLNSATGYAPDGNISDLDENLRHLTDSLSSHKRVLLSDENIFLKSSWTSAPFWPTMAALTKEIGAGGVTVVVYLRRQDDWIASAWRQSVKFGSWCESFGEFCSDETRRRSLDYAGLLGEIERAFDGAARIIVRRYDRRLFEGGDIYHDFCSATGIPWDAGYAIPDIERNISMTFDMAEAIRTFADAAPKGTPLRTNVLIPLMRRFSEERPDAPGTTPFDEEATRALMEPYLEGNRLISERYLDGAPLFSEEYGGRSVWAPDEERIAECRAAFEEAARAHGPEPRGGDALRALARKLPEGVKRPLRAMRKRLFGR